MMISPEVYVSMQKDKSYEELIQIREELIEDIKEFEKNPDQTCFMHPSPEVIYQVNLQYLGKLCELIAEKYKEEFVNGDEEE